MFQPFAPEYLAKRHSASHHDTEHPIIVHDRQSNKDKSSILARSLVKKARDVAESERVFRLATSDNVIICLLLEPLQSRTLSRPRVCRVLTGVEQKWSQIQTASMAFG